MKINYLTLEEDFIKVCEGLGLNIRGKLEKTASSNRKNPYSDYYDKESVSWVEKHFGPMIEYFNYKFIDDTF